MTMMYLVTSLLLPISILSKQTANMDHTNVIGPELNYNEMSELNYKLTILYQYNKDILLLKHVYRISFIL